MGQYPDSDPHLHEICEKLPELHIVAMVLFHDHMDQLIAKDIRYDDPGYWENDIVR